MKNRETFVQGRNINWKSNSKIKDIRVDAKKGTIKVTHLDGVLTEFPARRSEDEILSR